MRTVVVRVHAAADAGVSNPLIRDLPEHRVELIVLHVDGERLAVFACEGRDGARGLATASRHAERVHVVVAVDADAKHGEQGVDDQRVCVLEEERPFLAAAGPLFGEARAMEEVVDVAMTVRLCLDVPAVFLIDGEAAERIREGGHLVLHHDIHLGVREAIVVLLLQQRAGGRVGVARGHDHQRQLDISVTRTLTAARLERCGAICESGGSI
mmetsp:Transcript_106202/g.307373  ORF Transcript_106202/g.307373 Transcript_106202/m.307373 type:complete len:212 (+) Transcript_106202:1938-2573(+)